MKEQLKIVVDNNGYTKIWIDGIEQKHVTNVKFEVSNNHQDCIPRVLIEKDFHKKETQKPNIDLKVFVNKG